MSVHKKLMQARLELQATDLKKTGHNKFAGYQYFELGDFLPTAQKIFSQLGLSGVVSFGKEIATLTITDMDDGKSIVIESPMAEALLKGCHPIQNLGAAQTYLRRYLWVTALEIVEHDALDAVTGSESKGKVIPANSGGQDYITNADADEKLWLEEIAGNVRVLLRKKDIKGAYDELESHNLGIEQKSALWTLLESDEKSAIKKEGESRKQIERKAA